MYSLAMATIFVEATDNDGWARTHFKLYKYSQGERKYLAYGGGTSWQDKGKYKFIVEPGIYKILTAYGETHKEIKNIQIANKNYTWVSFDFSSKEYNHLEIYIRELTEQGDGDNLFELGEKISLKIEIGSGNSTKVAYKAKIEQNLKTEIISIDPRPRAEIDHLANKVIREPFENIDFNILDELNENDILFVDNSHRILPNSDSMVFYLEIFRLLYYKLFVAIL
jgi:hypothetical protein